MLSDFLLKITLKNNHNYKDKYVRNRIGLLSGIVGVIINVILFIAKLLIGFIVSSVAVIADAFNNLSDAASSIITIIGFKMAGTPADKNHPYGHGRVEYISALIISFLVIIVGLQFIKTSIERILKPEIVTFELIPFLILFLSIFLKLWLWLLNTKLSKKINSTSLKATATDSISDVFITSVVVISLLLSNFISFPIDGYIGVAVSLFILYSGFTLIKESISLLIGEAPNPQIKEDIENSLLTYDYVSGVHDLIIHNYGPGKIMASIHAEIPANIDIMTIHEIIDKAEREISDNLSIHLVIHMDPICVNSEEVELLREEIKKIIKYNPAIKSMHDFRVVGKGDKKNLLFDIVVDKSILSKLSSEEILLNEITDIIKDINPSYNCLITIDEDY